MIKGCQFNAGVECAGKGGCVRCGWEPVEAATRRSSIKKKGLSRDPLKGKFLTVRKREENESC